MSELTTIDRAEIARAEQNWRQSAGGRVLTFDMMLELPHSPKVAALGRDSEIVFEDKRYAVIHKEIVIRTSPDMVRLALNRTGGAAEPLRAEGGMRYHHRVPPAHAVSDR